MYLLSRGSGYPDLFIHGIPTSSQLLSGVIDRFSGGGGGSRTRVRKCYWSRDYMLIHVHAPVIRVLPPLPGTFAAHAQNGQETLAASLRS